MWLINTETLALESFLPEQAPPYAILSHTWGKGEVSLAEFQRLNQATRAKFGFLKIKKMCKLSRARGLDYAWVDTCCIDKASSAELSESINSMYAYYRKSSACFAFIDDWAPGVDWRTMVSQWTTPRWFQRGWTLQELIAPRDVQFYDASWALRGSKSDAHVVPHLSKITGISPGILGNGSEKNIRGVCLAQRMSWASRRETTRVEDMAYCLLGIFQINMPLLYGEGDRAFIRLQEEIIKNSTDMTLLAWEVECGTIGHFFARHPCQFAKLGDCVRLRSQFSEPIELTLTNKGVRIQGQLYSSPLWDGLDTGRILYLDTGCRRFGNEDGVFLAGFERQDSEHVYVRRLQEVTGELESLFEDEMVRSRTQTIYAAREPTYLIRGLPVMTHKRPGLGPVEYLVFPFSDAELPGQFRLGYKRSWPLGSSESRVAGTRVVGLRGFCRFVGYFVMELRGADSEDTLIEFLVLYFSDGVSSKLYTRLLDGYAAEEFIELAASTEEMVPLAAENTLLSYVKGLKPSHRGLGGVYYRLMDGNASQPLEVGLKTEIGRGNGGKEIYISLSVS